jgi:general secretion pathway protein D
MAQLSGVSQQFGASVDYRYPSGAAFMFNDHKARCLAGSLVGRILVAVLVGLSVAGCGGSLLGGPHRPQNEALEDLKAADLSARYPREARDFRGTGSINPATTMRRAEVFPGREDVDSAARSGPRAAAPANRGVTPAGEGYQLNFDNADLSDVAKAIFGDTLRQPYLVDPRVQAQITLATGRAVSRTELIKAFEAALKLANGALIADGDGYRIIPAAEATGGDVGRVERVRAGRAVQPGHGVSVMPLRHTDADAMLRLLDGFLAKSGSLRAEATGNLLLLRGSARERENLIDVIETFDVDWLKGQSAGIFPLAHATPDEMITELNQVMQTEAGNLGANAVRFQAVARLNAVLVLTRRVDHLRLVNQWIRRLDKTNAAGQTVFVYQVENGKAADIAQLLNDTFGSTGGSAPRRSARAEVAPGRGISQFGSDAGGRAAMTAHLGGSTFPASVDGSATQTAPVVRPEGGRTAQPSAPGIGIDVRIIADEANNTLLIRANQSEYQRILATLRHIDRPPLQVLINATIAEVTLNDALRYGVQAYLRSRKGSVGYHPGPVDLTLQPSFPGLNVLLGSVADPRLVLDALSDITSVKVVSSPSVVVVDNQPATLKVGDEVPISTQQSQSTIDPNAPVINSIRFRETGVILKVTPRVNSSGLVTMDVEQEISQVARRADGGPTVNLTPTISQRRIASTIAVYSGQTVALGGLISEQTSRDRQSVPLVNRIPLVGEIIGKSELQVSRTELIVFIKPQVIRNGEDASFVSEELRSQLKSMAFQPEPARYSRDHVDTASRHPSIKDVPRGR